MRLLCICTFHGRKITDAVIFRPRSCSDSDTQPVQTDQTRFTSFTGTGSPWPSLSNSVPTPTSPARVLAYQGGIYNA